MELKFTALNDKAGVSGQLIVGEAERTNVASAVVGPQHSASHVSVVAADVLHGEAAAFQSLEPADLGAAIIDGARVYRLPSE